MTCSSEGKQVEEEGRLRGLSSSESNISPYQYIISSKVNKKLKTYLRLWQRMSFAFVLNALPLLHEIAVI